MKRLFISSLFIFFLFVSKGQDAYEIEFVACELDYGNTYCPTCPGNTGIGVSVLDGIYIRDKETGIEKAFIPTPFKPKLVGGYVEIYTQTNEQQVNGLPTKFRARFEEYVLSDYSNYPSFPAMVDSLAMFVSCGTPTVTGEANVQSDWSEEDDTSDSFIRNKPQWYSDEIILTAGQTIFNTSFTPDSDEGVFFYLNGQLLGMNNWNRAANQFTFTTHVGMAGDYIIIKTYQ